MSGMPANVNGHAVIEPPNTCAPDTQLTVEPRRNLELSAEDTAALNAMTESHPEVGVFVSRAAALAESARSLIFGVTTS